MLSNGADGYITSRLVASPSAYCGLGFRSVQDGGAYTTFRYSIMADTGLTSYKIGIDAAAGIALNISPATLPALNDRLKVERVGTNINFYVARNATPTTWILVHTKTSAVTVPLFPGWFANASGSAMEIGEFSGLTQYVQWVSTAVALTMDGNSLVYGYRNPGPGVTVAQNLISDVASPLYGSGMTVTNSGTSGNTWVMMTGGVPNYTANRINVCVAWEGTNSICAGRTGLEAATDAVTYIATLKAANPLWRVVLMTCLPRQGGFAAWGSIAGLNAQIDAYNAHLRANYKAMGACALCDVRPAGGVFDMGGDYSIASFDACDTRAGGTVWLEASGGSGRIHMTDFGDTKIAALLEPVLAFVTLRDS